MGPESKARLITPEASASVRLNSWKEIANYLDRDPRTVQLWEKSEGLPVHRLNHQTRASVYAYSGEIDAWLRGRSNLAGGEAAEKLESESAPEPKGQRSTGMYILTVLALAATLAASFWIGLRQKAAARSSAPVLAVLPFQNQTSTDDFLVDGLTDELIADLGRIGKIQVIAHHSSMQFKGRQLTLPQVAAELHATLALEGTVAQAGNQTQVTVELLDAVNNTHLWGATYTRQAGDMVALQDEIASRIAIEVTQKVTGSVPQAVFPARAVDPNARKAYLEGRFYWNQRDLPGMQKAISSFGHAISIDPKYVPAYSGLAESYDLMTDRGILSDAEAFQRAKTAAQTALSLDPDSAEAYNALAFATYRQDWDFARAEQYFQKAIELNPNYAVAHQWYGEFLGDLRRNDESIAELRKAKDLDPLSPMVGSDLADGYLHAGRVVEAGDELKRVLDLYPDFLYAHLYRISLDTGQSDFAAAEAEAQVILKRTGDATPLQMVEIRRLVSQGNMDQARSEVRRLLSSRQGATFNAYSVAQLDFAIGQDDAGYAALEKAYRDHSWWLVTMLVDPGFSPVRNQPRFLDLARRVGLPVASNSVNRDQAER
jgi:TolB-like protein/tetratricopeptide (TPR) repeat protein